MLGEYRKVSDKYYINLKNLSGFQEVEGTPVHIKGMEEYDFFTHIVPIVSKTKSPPIFHFSEGITGTNVGGDFASEEEALSQGIETIKKRKDNILSVIEICVKGHGLSPRYNKIIKREITLNLSVAEILLLEKRAKKMGIEVSQYILKDLFRSHRKIISK